MKEKLNLKTNKFGMFMHVLAVISIIFALINGRLWAEVQILLTIRLVLYAIFFEIVVLNNRNFE